MISVLYTKSKAPVKTNVTGGKSSWPHGSLFARKVMHYYLHVGEKFLQRTQACPNLYPLFSSILRIRHALCKTEANNNSQRSKQYVRTEDIMTLVYS